MQFLHHDKYDTELTYNDVFLLPQHSTLTSRFDVDVAFPSIVGNTIPIIVSNMNAVAGKRMAETVARRGGVTILPQDWSFEEIEKTVSYIKQRHPIYETPITLQGTDTIARAMDLIHKRSHRAVIIVDDDFRPVGIFSEKDSFGQDRFTKLEKVMSREVITMPEGLPYRQMFAFLEKERLYMAPVINEARTLVGIVTQKGVVRSEIYLPAINSKGQFITAVAIGINGKPAERAKALLRIGVDCLVIDTAHGHQQKMLDTIAVVRDVVGDQLPIVAGNVVTAQATKDVLRAGANIAKVGIGPGAMCTTRMMTGVGRPQFSAVLECAKAATEAGGHIWADGGVKHPRDVALALAAGAQSVMIGSWFAGTFESAADTLLDSDGRLYKENYGMASHRAVRGRTENEDSFLRAKKELFEEGVSTSRLYINEQKPGVEDIIDLIISGLRSAMTYSGADTITEFQAKAVVGVQTAAGYTEGLPVNTNW